MFMKFRKTENCWWEIFNCVLKKKKQDSSTSTSGTGEKVYLFVFISSFGACIHVQYLFDVVRNQISSKVSRVNQKKV